MGLAWCVDQDKVCCMQLTDDLRQLWGCKGWDGHMCDGGMLFRFFEDFVDFEWKAHRKHVEIHVGFNI